MIEELENEEMNHSFELWNWITGNNYSITKELIK